MPEAFAVDFPNRRSAQAVRVGSMDELPAALGALGLTPRPTLVLVGGADRLTGGAAERLRALFADAIAPVVAETGAQVIDGATDAGVMRLMGWARGELSLSFPLIGVAPGSEVAVPGEAARPDAPWLEPNHSHFLLVAGDGWGTESRWIARLATLLTDGKPSVTLLVHGGEISWTDASQSVAEGRRVVAVTGSGGAADAAAEHLRGTRPDERAERLEASGLLMATEPDADRDSLRTVLRRLLGGGD